MSSLSDTWKSIKSTEEEEETLRTVVEKAEILQQTLKASMDELSSMDAELNRVSELARDQSRSNIEMAGAVDNIAQGTSTIVERLEGIRNSARTAHEAFELVTEQSRTLLEGMEEMERRLGQFKV
jgi:methyl-accepting chemotaxis protein